MTGSDPSEVATRLNRLLRESGLEALRPEQANRFAIYLSLILRWNARTNLTAVRDEEGILSRHFLECIAVAVLLPADVRILLDFGTGAGLPGIPIALCRPGITVTLAESQGKKAAFLQEAVRSLGLTAQVHAGRAEQLQAEFDCVTLRAVDRMSEAVRSAAGLVRSKGWLAVMTTRAQVAEIENAAGLGFRWEEAAPLRGSDQRILLLGHKS